MKEHKHQWQHYAVPYIQTLYTKDSDKYMDTVIEHFRACSICGVIQRFNSETKKWVSYVRTRKIKQCQKK